VNGEAVAVKPDFENLCFIHVQSVAQNLLPAVNLKFYFSSLLICVHLWLK
jgi:hypothetical protein